MNCLPKTVTRQRRDCDSDPGPTAPESSTLTIRLRELCLRQAIQCSIYAAAQVCRDAPIKVAQRINAVITVSEKGAKYSTKQRCNMFKMCLDHQRQLCYIWLSLNTNDPLKMSPFGNVTSYRVISTILKRSGRWCEAYLGDEFTHTIHAHTFNGPFSGDYPGEPVTER